MPNPRVAHCVFCDDIRHEIGNKHSMMGIYTKDLIIFGQLPTIMPTFSIVAWLICDIDDRPTQLKVRVVGPPNPNNETLLVGGEFNIEPQEPSEDAAKLQFRVILQMGGMPVHGEGYLEAFIDTEKGTVRAGRLKIHAQPRPQLIGGAPTAIISPSEPSQLSQQSSDVAPTKETKPAPSRPSRRRVSPKRRR